MKRDIRLAAEEEERAFYEGRASDEWLEALAPLGTDPEKPFLEIAPWLIAVFAQRRGGVRAGMDKKNYYINESVGIACGFPSRSRPKDPSLPLISIVSEY